MAFTEKNLKFTMTLGASSFGGSGNNTVVLDGLRAAVDIDHAGGMAMGTAKCQIYGMKAKTMEQLTMLAWQALSVERNTIMIEAVDATTSVVVFNGQIVNSWPDYQSVPDVFLHIEAQAGYYDQIAPSDPVSFKGVADVAVLMQQCATALGLSFENNGVEVKLSNPYLPNTALERAKSVVAAAGIEWFYDIDVLAIWPRGGSRKGDATKISADTGMVGYPTFDRVGVTFRTLFNSAVKFGGLVDIETDVPPAAGEWRVCGIRHNLTSQTPGGDWFSVIRCTESGLGPVK